METTKTKADVKKHIRTLKAKRDEAISRQAYKEVGQLRRGIRTLKRQSRVLARAAKAQATAAAAAPQAAS